MGFRFRKSFGKGPFRINISKSGIGYSVGVKGARITKTAKGTKRATLSVPGTGFSYVSETKSKKGRTTMINKSDCRVIAPKDIIVSQSWLMERLGLTAKEGELFMAIINNYSNMPFTSRDIAATGCAMSNTIYNGLYNKNVINKNTDKTYSLNISFINKIGHEYQEAEVKRLAPKGHSILLHLLFGWILCYMPAIYYTFSKKHYWHI